MGGNRGRVYADATPLPELMHVCRALGRARAGQTPHGNPTWQSWSRRAGRASGAIDTNGASLAEPRSVRHREQTGASPGGEMDFRRAVEA